MRALTTDEIQVALGRLKSGVDRYLWLQRNLRLSDVSTDEQFQTYFNGFYKVRRNSSWRSKYFELMESAKLTGIDFPDALTEIQRRTGRIEASFASKLVATLDPSRPVVDRFVLKNFELKLPRRGIFDRLCKIVSLYNDLCDAYSCLIQSPTGITTLVLFEGQLPGTGISDLKKIDLVLWQIRP